MEELRSCSTSSHVLRGRIRGWTLISFSHASTALERQSANDWDINYINQTVWNMTILIMSWQSVGGVWGVGGHWTENKNIAEGERSRETDVLSHYGNDLSRTFQWHLAICAAVLQETRNRALKANSVTEAYRKPTRSAKNFSKHFCHSDSMDLHLGVIWFSL